MAISVGILVGGASRRMGYPKALVHVDGTTLLERTVGIASSVGERVFLLGQPPFDVPAATRGLPTLSDAEPGIGPIGGLAALLTNRPEDDCFLLACDMPYLSKTLLRRLIDGGGESCDAVVPQSTHPQPQYHPCCALYRPTAHAHVAAALIEHQYAMHRLLGRLHVRTLPLSDDESTWVANWNSLHDIPVAGDTT